MPADLMPFGFTATESMVYSTLLRLGPATGYAVARAQVELRIAGDAPTEAPELVVGTTPPDHPTVLVIDNTQTLAAVSSGDGLAAVWTSHPAIVALARRALGGAP